MVRMARIHATGFPESLSIEELGIGDPGPGEVRIRHSAAGVNYVDVYHRTGLYPVPAMPAVLGVEGAGVIEAIGDGVVDLEVGDRVAWAGLPIGGYAEARLLPAERALRLPPSIPEQTAAAALLRGITAHMLLRSVTKVKPGDVVLIHAAAGGLGLILTQWARRLGATVIGTVGSAEKGELASRLGLQHTIPYKDVDFVREVLAITDGRGVDLAFDGVGGEVLKRTLDCVRSFGMVVSVGQASGSLPSIELSELGPRRSLAIARPSVLAYAADPSAYREAATALFEAIEGGLEVQIGAKFTLDEVGEAHKALEAGRTMGSLLITF